MQGFYNTICGQNDQLKNLLEKTDFSKIAKMRDEDKERDETRNISIIKSSGVEDLPFSKRIFTSSGTSASYSLPAHIHFQWYVYRNRRY